MLHGSRWLSGARLDGGHNGIQIYRIKPVIVIHIVLGHKVVRARLVRSSSSSSRSSRLLYRRRRFIVCRLIVQIILKSLKLRAGLHDGSG